MITAVRTVMDRDQFDRIIVISDEQAAMDKSHLPDPKPGQRCYMVNVASAKNGIGYGLWTHLDGFSEAVIRYIAASEASDPR